MKLWILQPLILPSINPRCSRVWIPSWGKNHGFVIKAESEIDARELADTYGADENMSVPGVRPWLDPEFSTCTELVASEGESCVVLAEYIPG